MIGTHIKRLENLDVSKAIDYTPLKFFREKRWCYIGIVNNECVAGTALVHLGYACNAFSFVYDRQEKTFVEANFVFPPTGVLKFDRNPDQGDCRFQSKSHLIEMLHRHQLGKRFLNINIKNKIKGHIEISESIDSNPLQLLTPMEKGKKVFTQKIAGLKVKGSISTNSKTFNFSEENTFALFDWTNGFHDRKTSWNWASAAGISKCNRLIGFNFSFGVYKYGYSENVIWIDQRPKLQDEITFNYNPKDPLKPWHITNQEKTVDLIFTPEQKRQAKDNFGLVASSFTQPIGTFSGHITSQSGERIHLENIVGVTEDHFAKW